ncbi:MAG: archaeosortase/exosortase family protein [Candidatus Aenigmatarchaeota archaeon]
MKKRTRKKLLQVIWFLIKFNLLAIPLYVLIFINFSYQPLQNLVAFLSYKFLQAFKIQANLNQSSLMVIRGTEIAFIEIDMDCTGWKSLYALFSLAIATPSIKWKKKFIFLIFALPSIFLFNIARIVITIYFSLIRPDLFGFVHDFFWQFGLIFAILASWVLWLRYEKRI